MRLTDYTWLYLRPVRWWSLPNVIVDRETDSKSISGINFWNTIIVTLIKTKLTRYINV